MKRIPKQFVDTSNDGQIMPQLTEPPNAEYIIYLLEKFNPATRGKAMKLVMTEYHGRANPAMVDTVIKKYFEE